MNDQQPPPQQKSAPQDHAGVVIPPPLVFLTFLVAGIWAQSDWIDGLFPVGLGFYAGALLVLLALLILLASAVKFKTAKTSIEPWKPTSNIISHGPYGYSRNPLYVAMILTHLGIAAAAGSYAALLSVLPCVIFIRYYVIAREEAYLERKFGAEYMDYKNAVRRWI